MTTINSALNTAVSAAILTGVGAGLGQSLKTFGAMQFTLGAMVAGLFQPAPAQPKFSATMPEAGKAEIDIGDGYTLSINEASSEITVRDADGNATRIWGDPHVDYNGKHIGDFWGTTTFQLENGTKITINTEKSPWNDMTFAEQVVITRGDQALVVDGVSEVTKGDLSVSLSTDGRALDAAHDDGFVIHENDASSTGWTSSITGGDVGQADFNLTKPGMEPVREALEAFNSSLGLMLTGWLLGVGVAALAEGSTESSAANAKAAERFPLLSL
ncbi:hypothetical protein AS593_01785 [Caulobacter vibrioides]|nr:hypothetical protein AS593_01785 [Caulobacter vibrioides]